MKYITIISSLILCFIFVCISTSSFAATERRTALIIGNSGYLSSPLANPVNDAEDMKASLIKLGFDVVLKKDAKLQEMEEAIRDFGDRLKSGGVGLFYYAGHGVQIGGRNYLIPVGANIRKETDTKYQAIDAEMIIDEMANASNNVNIVILDACRDNPFDRSFRSASRGLAIISSAPKGTIISYSTSPGKVAADGSGRNSPYTSALIKNMNVPELSIEEVFKKVRQELGSKTGGQQIPWELSSLEGNFSFLPTKSGKAATYNNVTKNNLDDDARQLAEEKQRLQREKEILEQRKQLLEEEKSLALKRKMLEEEKSSAAALSSTPSNYIRRINAKVERVDFYESPYGNFEKKDRVYKSSFPKAATRYVNWELNLKHPEPGRKIFYDIEAIWYGPDGKIIYKNTSEYFVESDWIFSWRNGGYGWREAGPNTWKPGTFKVDLFVDGELVASGRFDIRD